MNNREGEGRLQHICTQSEKNDAIRYDGNYIRKHVPCNETATNKLNKKKEHSKQMVIRKQQFLVQ